MTKKKSSKWKVFEYNKGSFYVPSRRNIHEGYIVDTTESPWTCCCDSYMFRHRKERGHECWHIKYIKKLLGLKQQ
jgi:hypothetical protein